MCCSPVSLSIIPPFTAWNFGYGDELWAGVVWVFSSDGMRVEVSMLSHGMIVILFEAILFRPRPLSVIHHHHHHRLLSGVALWCMIFGLFLRLCGLFKWETLPNVN